MRKQEDNVTNIEKAKTALEEIKKIESQQNMKSMRLNKQTIVFCKNEDRFELYKKSLRIC